jgi:hypothetical protein
MDTNLYIFQGIAYPYKSKQDMLNHVYDELDEPILSQKIYKRRTVPGWERYDVLLEIVA